MPPAFRRVSRALSHTPTRSFAPVNIPIGFTTYVQTDAPTGQALPGSSVVTFANCAIGAAATNRVVVVTVTGNVGDPSLSMTIGGVSATLAVAEGGHVVSELAIYYAVVPTGTVADVVITYTTTVHDVLIVVGKFTYGSTFTPADTKLDFSSASAFQQLNTTIPSGGFAVMGVATQNGPFTPTWNSNMVNNPTGDYQRTIDDGSNVDTFYVAHSTTAGSPTTLRLDLSASTFVHSVSASWGT